METSILLWIGAGLAVVAGVVGTVLPALPGAALVWLGLLLAAWADGFARVSGWTVALLGLLAVATYPIDLVAAGLGARRMGASRWALAGAVVGALVGVLFGLPGLLLGPFVGAAAGEYWTVRDARRAGRVGAAAAVAFVLGTAAKLAVVAAMLGLFALAYLV